MTGRLLLTTRSVHDEFIEKDSLKVSHKVRLGADQIATETIVPSISTTQTYSLVSIYAGSSFAR